MPTLPAVMVTLLLPFEHLFDPRTWRKAQLLATQLLAMGAILSPGKRTVSSALNILGIGQHGDFAVYHHVLNRAQWSPLQLSRALLLLVAGRLGSSTEPLVFGIDETVERRWGRKIAAKGRYRDPVRSTDDQVVMTPGLQWVSLTLLTRIGWAGRHWALPFLTALVVSARYDRRKGPAPDGHRLRPADAGLPAPLAAGEGPGGGGRWRLRQARVPARVCQSRLSSSPNCARTRPCTRRQYPAVQKLTTASSLTTRTQPGETVLGISTERWTFALRWWTVAAAQTGTSPERVGWHLGWWHHGVLRLRQARARRLAGGPRRVDDLMGCDGRARCRRHRATG